MKLNSLDLIGRLSRIRDEQAGDAVKTRRHVLDEVRHQAKMLDAYRRNLCIAKAGQRELNGQALRARAVFISVAEAACGEVRRQMANSEAELKDALQRWAEVRERMRVVQNKYESTRKQLSRENEKKAEKDLPANPRRRG